MKKITCCFPVILIVLCSVGFPGHLHAQNYIHVIEDATGGDFVQQSIAKVNNAEYIVVGTVIPGPVSGNSDILAMKIDAQNTIVWAKYIDYGQDEFAGSLLIDDRDDFVVITGYTGINGSEVPTKNLIIVKLDQGGDLINDVTIADTEAGYRFGLYGMDIAQVNKDDYYIVGTGANGAYLSTDKYAFVMRVRQGLQAVVWGYRYESFGGGSITTQYDSFNDILKVENHPASPVLLLTGAGMALSNNKRMMTNDLIRLNGSSLWGGAVGHWEQHSVNHGISALYQEWSNRFFIVYNATENTPSFSVLDGNTGNGLAHTNLHNHIVEDFYWNPNDIAWSGSGQQKIVLAGYHLEPYPPPDTAHPMFIEWDIASSSIRWIRYDLPFNGNDFMNINFDYIVQPINYTNPSPQISQIYYKPKSLVRLDNGDFIFAAPYQKQPGDPFGLSFFKTDGNGLFGETQSSCIFDVTKTGNTMELSLNDEPNFVQQPHAFDIVGSGAQVIDANPNDFITCYQQPKPLMGTNSVNESPKIFLYPNPAKKHLNIFGLGEIENPIISVYNTTGQRVIHKTGNHGKQTQLSVSELQNGIYFVQITFEGKVVFQEKIVKK